MHGEAHSQDHYAVLGVPPDAGQEAIKLAYRRLALQYHPDVNPSPQSQAIFQRIQAAYTILSDTAQRNRYDFLRRFGVPMEGYAQRTRPAATRAATATGFSQGKGRNGAAPPPPRSPRTGYGGGTQFDPAYHKRNHLQMTHGVITVIALVFFCFLSTLVCATVFTLVLNLFGIAVSGTAGMGVVLLALIITFIGLSFRLGQHLLYKYPQYVQRLARYFHHRYYRPPDFAENIGHKT